jgi:ubiquinone/menaquinone biosynthesis C-methylase UbiE
MDRAGPTDCDAELRLHNEVLRQAGGVQPAPVSDVRDIGCGSGQTTCEAARMAQGGSALGVDISASAIERARELARAQGKHNITFERTKSGDLLFKDLAKPLQHMGHTTRSPVRTPTSQTTWLPLPTNYARQVRAGAQ